MDAQTEWTQILKLSDNDFKAVIKITQEGMTNIFETNDQKMVLERK